MGGEGVAWRGFLTTEQDDAQDVLFSLDAEKPYIPYAARCYGKPGRIYVAQTGGANNVYRIGLTTASSADERVEQLKNETGKAWRLVWWKYSKDCGRSKNAIFKALNHCKRPSKDGAMFFADIATIKDVVRAACENPRKSITPPRQAQKRMRFTVFQAKTDGNWYWFLKDTDTDIAIARGNPHADRAGCEADIAILSKHIKDAEVWDASNGESLMPTL